MRKLKGWLHHELTTGKVLVYVGIPLSVMTAVMSIILVILAVRGPGQ